MGRQVNFYLTPADECELLNSLPESEAIVAYPLLAERRGQHISDGEMLEIVPRYGTRQYGLSLSYFSPKLRYNSLPKQPNLPNVRWRLDPINSEVIQYTRCSLEDGDIPSIKRGRLWIANRLDTGELKDSEFIAWSGGVLSKVRSKLSKIASLTYVGDEAMRLHASSEIELR